MRGLNPTELLVVSMVLGGQGEEIPLLGETFFDVAQGLVKRGIVALVMTGGTCSVCRMLGLPGGSCVVPEVTAIGRVVYDAQTRGAAS